MAHSCRWRFPARPGGITNAGSGRKAGRIRVTASLRTGTGTHPNTYGLGPGFDAALQVSAAIGNNLQKFRDVFGEASGSSSGEEELFCGFGAHNETRRIQNPARTSTATSTQAKKPRGRPPRALAPPPFPASAPQAKPEGLERPPEKPKRPPGRPPGSGDKRRGRPPALGGQYRDIGLEDSGVVTEGEQWGKKAAARRTALAPVQQQATVKLPRGPRVGGRISKATKLKRLQGVKLGPLQAVERKGVPVPVGPRRRRGRPPSAERLKAEAAAGVGAGADVSGDRKQKAFRVRRERPSDPDAHQHLELRAPPAADPDSDIRLLSPSAPPLESPSSRTGRPAGVRQSPRRIIVPPPKRTDATIAKQLLQRAKKGAQKKKLLEKEGALGGPGAAGVEADIRRRRRTQLKNIRQFIMPVVSTVSLRIIKTPKRFIEDESSFGAPPPHLKMPRVDTASSAAGPQQPPSSSSSSSPLSMQVSSSAPPSLPPPPAPPAPSGLLNNNNNSGSCNNSTSNGRFSSSAASCGSSAASQRSSQLSSAESSRSSSPSLESSSDSQGSEATRPDRSPSSQGKGEAASLLHESHPPTPPLGVARLPLTGRGRRGRQGQVGARGGLAGRGALTGSRKKSIIGPASGILLSSSSRVGSKQATSTASSSSSPPPPPPPLLTPPQTAPSSTASASASALSEHHPHSAWIVPHPITPFISTPVLSPLQQEKRHSILREPTFRWESVSRSEQRYFSSAKYAKEGLIRKPVFDNFRPPPLTAEDVGLLPSGGGVTGGVAGSFPGQGAAPGAGSRLFSPLQPHPRQHPSSRFDLQPPAKRSPLLRAPQFTPSEAHSRIFESVTLLSPVGSSAGPAPRQASPATRTPRRRKRKVFGPVSGQPRSPSHPMATRSSQSGMQAGKGSASPLPGHASTSALTPTSFAAFSTEGAVESYQPAGRRPVGGLAVGGDSSSTSSSPLFPLFSPSPQGAGGGRERGASASQETGTRDRERDQERAKEREKENKKEGQKERNRKGKSAAPEGASGTASGLFATDELVEESSVSVASKKTRKKAISVDSVTEVTSDLGSATGGGSLQVAAATSTSKGRLHKKGRTTDRGQEAEAGCKESNRERSGPPVPQMTQPGAPRKQLPVASLGSMLAQAEKQQVTDKHVAGLLKKAKDQLNKIEKSKSIKTTDLPKAQGQESDSSEASARGPRIKHVCRRAAVALGRNRAVFPDDMPTLSALPWEEREKILSSMGNDDKSSVAGSEEAEPLAPPIKPIKPIKPMTRHKTVQEPPARKGRRSRRCGQCPGCQVPDDCGVCTNCLDKPKFGGRNIKKQCCKVRKCQNLQWMPSKAFLQKQAKAKKEKKNNKMAEKKEAHHSSESDPKPTPPQPREEPTRKKSETPPPKHNEEKPKQPRQQPLPPPSPAPKDPPPAPCSPPAQEPKQPVAPPGVTSRKEHKTQPAPPATSAQSTPEQAPSQPPQSPPSQLFAKKEGVVKAAPCEPKKRPQQKIVVLPNTETASEAKQMKRLTPQCSPAPKQKPKEREKLALTKPEGGAVNLPTIGPWIGGHCRPRGRGEGVRRIRVDFKEDRDVENVWEMGGLSILTSVPITPRVVCFLCASSGHVEFVFCQVCCEPFHLFCLDEKERPLQEQLENWCCRRCRFCHVCGRQHQKTKQLLECNKCRNSYHPECLGPNHPTRPTKKKRVWICTMCVRCKSCGATTPGKGWDAQWSHDFSMCHDCAKLFAKGNFCPLCDKCYDDDDYESKMMQCGKCDCWVHSKCENLTDEMYEILSSLPVAYTCTNCTERHPAEWRTALEKELQGSVRQVLTALLNSRTSTHLLRYRQAVMKPPELNPEPEESLPSRRSPEGPDPPVLTEVTPPSDSPLDLETVKRKMEMGSYNSVLEFSDDIVRIIQTAMNFDGGQPENKKANSMVKSFFIRQMERVFPWFKVKESRFWEPHKVSSNSGLLPNAVLPPSLDHNYAQWQEREEIARAEQPALMKKIIPAPRPKAPGEPDSPTPPSPPCLHGLDLCREECPELLPPPDVGDNRQCALCLKYGDDNTNDSGRLLYIGQNEWTHVNCALWSAEVFEDDDGSLKNVHMAVIRGRQLRCEHCQRPGATVGCCLTSCTSNFHFMCARLRHCVFLEDKKVYCQRHRDLIKGEVVSESGFEVTRRILVDLEGISLRRKFLNGLEPENVHMMIGSMTIDCLGILTELSDCEHKLFPVGYQCSRVYWSTLDARKRCVYTCRILVCRPPVVEPDINHTVEHEENHTISHSSPSSASDLEIPPSPGSTEPLPGRLQPLPPTPVPKAVARSRHPSYPPCQRSPSSRPLPSPGGPSISTHEIVTVGDPVLSSSLRSIGSRRHSTSSLSPLPTKPQTPSPSQGGGKLSRLGVFSSSPSVFTAARDSGSRDIERERPTRPSSIGNQNRESRMLSPSSQSKGHTSISEKRTDGGREGANKQAGEEKSAEGGVLLELGRGSQASASLGGAVPPAGHQKINSGYKMDKGKQGGKDAYLLTGTCPVSRGPLATLMKDGSSEDSFMDASLISPPIPKDTVSPSSPQPQHFKSGGRKSRDPLPGSAPAVATKPLQSSGIAAAEDTVKRGSQATPALVTSLGVSGPKEGRSKGRTQDSRERNSRNSTAQTASTDAKGTGLMEGKMYESQTVESPLKARDRFSSLDKKNICATERTQSRFGPEKGFKASHVSAESTGKELSQRDKKRTVKVTLTPLKMDPNGTKAVSSSSSSDTTTTMTSLSPASQGSNSRSSRPLLFSPSASSESLESDAQHHKEDPEEDLLAHRCARADQGDEPPVEDAGGTDKCREDDSDSSASVKRRYPRRSARARANMFFGLTPFYGVRSYGEEDIPFYGSGDAPGKRRIGGGGSKRSAEGQVDGADDMSSSSSGESGEEEEGGIGPCTDEDTYYYNFTRTIIHPGGGIPPAGGLELQRFLKEETEDEEMVVEEGAGIGARSLGLPRIGQLDGVDDGSESDASTSATSTTVAAASTSNKSTSKRKNRDRRAEKLAMDSAKEAANSAAVGGGGSNSRDGRKTQKENCLPLVVVKSQGQDSLDAQLSLNSELLKSDSDNTSSDDCGNILPSDIMEFVLNTPSMQSLGQQQESGSSELLSLEEGFELDGNRGKDISLFEDFPQPLPSADPVEGGVNSSISGEEPYGLPLELPSDLSVLTTRSPSVTNQNHTALIAEPSKRTVLSLPGEDAVEKGGDKHPPRGGASRKVQSGVGGGGDSQGSEGHLTPEHFIPGHLEAERMTSPPVSQVVEPGSQDLARSSGTPGLPNSPSMPLQGQKYLCTSAEAPASSQVTSTAVQTTATHLKPGTEKLIVVNQHMQPLYVLQTLPNGVTQKIQISPSVSEAGVMETSSMAGGLALPPGLAAGITTSQSIFAPGGKSLVSMPHHPQIQAFAGATQTGFQPGIPSTTSGLLIGVHSQDPQVLVSEAGHHSELVQKAAVASGITSVSSSSSVSTSGHGKKRPISRLQPRKTKKLARSGSQPSLTPSESRPNMTLINFSPTQIPAGISPSTGMVELGALTAAPPTAHRKIPNIIKRPKLGVFFEPTATQGLSVSTAPVGILPHESSAQLVPCTVSGLSQPNQALLNVVSVPAGGPSGLLGAPGLLSPTEISGMLLPDQQMVLPSGTPQLSGLAQTSNTNSVCVLPSQQDVGQQADQVGAYHLQHHLGAGLPLTDKHQILGHSSSISGPQLPASGTVAQEIAGCRTSDPGQSSRTTPISRASDQHTHKVGSAVATAGSTVSGKGKQKAKRSRHNPEEASGRKHKLWRLDSPQENQGGSNMSNQMLSVAGGAPETKAASPVLVPKTMDIYEAKPKTPAPSPQPPQGKEGSGMTQGVAQDPGGHWKDLSLDSKPRKGLMFEICSDDGFKIRCESIEEAWKSLTDKVQEARSNARLKELSFEGVNGLRMLGVIHDAVAFLLEQLYGARHCARYRFRFHKPEESDDPPLNPSGIARGELHHRRSAFDVFNFLASKHRQPPKYNPYDEEEEEVQLKSARRATSMDLPMPMRFRHLKKASKEAVGVYRSAIHGRGLFCKRNIDPGEMVIEYSGNVIRSVLTDKREKYYDGKGIGCYMFRIDDFEVVDATIHGNAARFINHSCEPNCYSRVISVEGKKHIVIFAMRKIFRGEELTYDYKFPIEDPGSKLPCNCGAKKCRKFLN